MIDYRYADKDGDMVAVWTHPSTRNTAVLSADGGIYIPADEVPKTAQALLDAAGVQGSVVVGELPEVSETYWGGSCVVNGTGNTIPCDLKYLDRTMLELLAVKAHVQAREAEREAGLAKVRDEADRLVAGKKAHDDLRTSPIALKALAIYNRVTKPMRSYTSWDATNDGYGASDFIVKEYIEQAEQEEAKEKEAAEKLAARRDAVMQEELDSQFHYEELPENHPMRRAVDLILKERDKKGTDA